MLISDVTDKILPQIEEWQNRPLDDVYPVVYIDAIHYSVRDNGVIVKKAAYGHLEKIAKSEFFEVPFSVLLLIKNQQYFIFKKINSSCQLLAGYTRVKTFYRSLPNLQKGLHRVKLYNF